MKWSEAEVEEFRQGRLPVTTFTDPEWTLGNVEEGFKKASLVLDETFVSAIKPPSGRAVPFSTTAPVSSATNAELGDAASCAAVPDCRIRPPSTIATCPRATRPPRSRG